MALGAQLRVSSAMAMQLERCRLRGWVQTVWSWRSSMEEAAMRSSVVPLFSLTQILQRQRGSCRWGQK